MGAEHFDDRLHRANADTNRNADPNTDGDSNTDVAEREVQSSMAGADRPTALVSMNNSMTIGALTVSW